MAAAAQLSPQSKKRKGKKLRPPQRAGTVRALPSFQQPSLSNPMLRLVPTPFPAQDCSKPIESAGSEGDEEDIATEKKTQGDCADDIAVLNAEK